MHLIVGAVFADDQEHVLDQRRIADLGRERDRWTPRAAPAGRRNILRQIPVVVGVDLSCHRRQLRGIRKLDDTDGAVVLMRVVAGDTIIGLGRETRADALVVGDDHRAFLMRGVVRYCDEARVADRAAVEHNGSHRCR